MTEPRFEFPDFPVPPVGKMFFPKEKKMNVDKVLRTDGKGLWSDERRDVRITELHIRPYEDGRGELRVYFDRKTWDVEKHGLIYTDDLFEQELREFLKSLSLSGSVVYSEQGMQSDDYVSFDVTSDLVSSFTERC